MGGPQPYPAPAGPRPTGLARSAVRRVGPTGGPRAGVAAAEAGEGLARRRRTRIAHTRNPAREVAERANPSRRAGGRRAARRWAAAPRGSGLPPPRRLARFIPSLSLSPVFSLLPPVLVTNAGTHSSPPPPISASPILSLPLSLCLSLLRSLPTPYPLPSLALALALSRPTRPDVGVLSAQLQRPPVRRPDLRRARAHTHTPITCALRASTDRIGACRRAALRIRIRWLDTSRLGLPRHYVYPVSGRRKKAG